MAPLKGSRFRTRHFATLPKPPIASTRPPTSPSSASALAPGREVLAIAVESRPDTGPFTYDGRAYERVQSTTRKMTQAKYEKRLLDRAYSKRRWENAPAEGLALKDLDRKEILRTASWPFSRTGFRRTPAATLARSSTG